MELAVDTLKGFLVNQTMEINMGHIFSLSYCSLPWYLMILLCHCRMRASERNFMIKTEPPEKGLVTWGPFTVIP